MSDDKSIRRNNPAIQKLDDLIALGSMMPEGSDVRRMAQSLSGLPDLPDTFNAAFTRQGWLYVEFACGYEAAQQALQMNENGLSASEIDAFLADNLLALDPIYWQSLKHMGGGMAEPAHPVRAELTERAFQAYRDTDYIVCVPLLLMLIDGYGVTRIGNKSIFSDLAEIDHLFESVESVGGHPSGLKAVLKQMVGSAKGYSEEALTLPVRNGILHGTRLNYGNRIVAAKALNVLAGVIEWASDTATEPRSEISRKKWNENFLKQNLGRLAPDSPENALLSMQAAFDAQKAGDAVALIDYDPVYTDLSAKLQEWKSILSTYEVTIKRVSDWEVFGGDSDSEQHARCSVLLDARTRDGKQSSLSEETLIASRRAALRNAGLPSSWQVAIGLLGLIRARLPAKRELR